MPHTSYLPSVPRIEVLDGDIVITINTRDHLPPHVHVRFAGEQVLLCIEDGSVYEGSIPRPQRKRAQQYVRANRDMLLERWDVLQAQGRGQAK